MSVSTEKRIYSLLDFGALDGNDPENTRVVQGTPMPTDIGDNAGNDNAWSWAVLNRCGVVLLGFNPLQGAYAFQHQDRFAFSPLPTNPASVEGIALLGLLFAFAKSKGGLKALERLAVKYLDSCADTIQAISSMGKANFINGGGSIMLISSMLHRIGLLDDQGLVRVQEHVRTTFDKQYLLDVLNAGIGGITTLVEGSKITTQESTGTASGQGLGALAALAQIGKAAVP